MPYTLQYRIARDIADKVAFEVSKVAARTVDEQGQTKYDLLKIYNSDTQFVTDFIEEAKRRILAEFSDIATDSTAPYIIFRYTHGSDATEFRTSAWDHTETVGGVTTLYYSWGGTDSLNAFYTLSPTPSVGDSCYENDQQYGMVLRSGAITEYGPNDGVNFDLPDFDTTQKDATLAEIERFVVLYVVARWFETRLPEMGKSFAESAEASAVKMQRLIRARKAITR